MFNLNDIVQAAQGGQGVAILGGLLGGAQNRAGAAPAQNAPGGLLDPALIQSGIDARRKCSAMGFRSQPRNSRVCRTYSAPSPGRAAER
jgi:hypothetical protein